MPTWRTEHDEAAAAAPRLHEPPGNLVTSCAVRRCSGQAPSGLFCSQHHAGYQAHVAKQKQAGHGLKSPRDYLRWLHNTDNTA